MFKTLLAGLDRIPAVCALGGVKRTSFGHPEHPPMTQSGHRPEFKLRRQRRPSPPIKALASTSTILAPEPGANMRRREFFAGLTGALAMPLSAQAQQTTTRTIGWFSLRSADTDSEKSILAAFREGLGQTGYVEGRNLTIEYGFADGQYDRLPLLAADLVRRRVEVLMTTGGANIARVAQAATPTIPVIFATANDPGPGRPRQKHQSAGRQQYRSVCVQYRLAAEAF
jgi:hypothetical protein